MGTNTVCTKHCHKTKEESGKRHRNRGGWKEPCKINVRLKKVKKKKKKVRQREKEP